MNPDGLKETALAITRWVGSPASIVVHTALFLFSFALAWFGWLSFDRMLLVLTTLVSLEAIYLAIFIQMTLNVTNEAVEDISEDVEEMQEDVDEIQQDIDEIQEDVDEIQEDVDELQEDVEEISEEEEEEEHAEEMRKAEQKKTLVDIQTDLRKLMADIEKLQR